MDIRLIRVTAADEFDEVQVCAICGDAFELGALLAMATTGDRVELGPVCTLCVVYMAAHPSGRFSSLSEYRHLEREWSTPLHASGEAADIAESHLDD